MKSIIKASFYVPFVLFGAVFLNSCGSKTDINAETAAANLFSKTKPAMVLSISPRTLLDKSGMSNGEVMPKAFAMLFSEMTDYVTKESKTGISFDGKSFAAFNFNEKGSFDHLYCIYNLKDPERFATMIKEDLEVDPAKNEGFNYALSPEGNVIIGWYKTFGIALIMEKRSEKEAALKKLTELMQGAIEEGKAEERYQKLLENKNDISFLYDFGAMMQLAQQNGDAKTEEMVNNLKDIYGTSYSIYSLNFDTDKITAEINNYLNDKSSEVFNKMFGKGVDPSYMSFLTNQDLIGFYSLALMPEPCLNFYKELSEEAYAQAEREISRETPLQLKDLSGGFTGELTMAMVSFKESEKSYSYTNEDGKEEVYSYKSTDPVFTMTIGLNGDLVKSILDTTKMVTKKGNYFTAETSTFFAFTSDKLFISNDEALVATVANEGKLKAFDKNGIATEASANPAFGYFDFKALSGTLPSSDKESKAIIDLFDYAIASGNANHFKGELYLTKSGKNSLYIMTSTIMNTYFSLTF